MTSTLEFQFWQTTHFSAEHYLRFLNVWLGNASIKRTPKYPKMKTDALRKKEMCSNNTINDEEEKFVSSDKTFIEEEEGRDLQKSF